MNLTHIYWQPSRNELAVDHASLEESKMAVKNISQIHNFVRANGNSIHVADGLHM